MPFIMIYRRTINAESLDILMIMTNIQEKRYHNKDFLYINSEFLNIFKKSLETHQDNTR